MMNAVFLQNIAVEISGDYQSPASTATHIVRSRVSGHILFHSLAHLMSAPIHRPLLADVSFL